jgi:hypothetical protein
MTREEQVLDLLNAAWAIIPEKPKYNDFNSKIPFGRSVPGLEALEQINHKLGLADFEPYPLEGERVPFEVKGMTVLSLIATITDILCDKRLAANIEADGTITGWCWCNA